MATQNPGKSVGQLLAEATERAALVREAAIQAAQDARAQLAPPAPPPPVKP